MVDNILKDSKEVAGSDDEDLSGDENKTPVFVITKVDADKAMNSAQSNPEEMDMDEEAEELLNEEDALFVQEEYDLAANLDMITSRLHSFDEFKFFADSARQYHAENAQYFQEMVTTGLNTERQKEYLKQIM